MRAAVIDQRLEAIAGSPLAIAEGGDQNLGPFGVSGKTPVTCYAVYALTRMSGGARQIASWGGSSGVTNSSLGGMVLRTGAASDQGSVENRGQEIGGPIVFRNSLSSLSVGPVRASSFWFTGESFGVQASVDTPPRVSPSGEEGEGLTHAMLRTAPDEHSGMTYAAVAYEGAHNEATRLAVMRWLESRYTPPPEPTWEPNPSGGTGGLRGDYTEVSRTNGDGVTSSYHIYADHITGDEPLGVIYALHGDGAGWYTNPNSDTMEATKQLARDRNMLLVIPRTPDQTQPYTWWESFSYGTWLADLHSWVTSIHNVDRNEVYWFGYSGGAEVLTYNIMAARSSRFTGGAMIIMGGGGKSSEELYAPISDELKTPGRFLMHWVVGELDNPADGGDDGGFDAVQASINGEAYYSARNVPTQLSIVPGRDHYDILPDGLAALEDALGPA